MTTTITRKFGFDAGHRVWGHEGKCKHLHGHRYTAEVTILAPKLDNLGRIVDFGEVKELIGSWIDANWDHNLILYEKDDLASLAFDQRHLEGIFQGKQPYIMTKNPTAENIAEELYLVGCDLLRDNHCLQISEVRIWETPNCCATFKAPV